MRPVQSIGSSARRTWTLGTRSSFVAARNLWVVVSDPAADPEQVLIVNVTSVRRSFHDSSCLLNVGDHRFVQHASYMEYSRSRIESGSELRAKLATGSIIPDEPISADVLQRIRDGAARTDRIPLRNLQLLVDQGLIDSESGCH